MVRFPLELTLTPHELFALPAGTPATGPAIRVEVTPDNGPDFFALARVVKFSVDGYDANYYRVFFRDEQRPEDEIFVCGHNGHVAQREAPDAEKVRRRVTKAASRRSITRFWRSPGLPYCVTLNCCGRGTIITPGAKYDSWGDFHMENWNKDQFWEWSTDEFHTFCEKLAANPNSGLNYFLEWNKLSEEEKTALATQCERGDWKQLRRLFTWVLQLIIYHFGNYPYEHEQSSHWWFTHEIPRRYDRPAVFFARRWQKTIFEIARPHFYLPSPLSEARQREGLRSVSNHVDCGVPTAHEFLEAQLGLREFLRPHLSEGEIEALFIP